RCGDRVRAGGAPGGAGRGRGLGAGLPDRAAGALRRVRGNAPGCAPARGAGVCLMRFQRAVGVAIIGSAMLGALLLWLAIAASGPRKGQAPQEGLLFGAWRVFYATEMPSASVLLAAMGVALLLAAG